MNREKYTKEKKYDRVAIMPLHLRDCVRWAMNIHKDKIMEEHALMEKYQIEDRGGNDPLLIQTRWMKVVYGLRRGKYYPIGITYLNWPSAAEVHEFLMANLDYCDFERVNRVCERIQMPGITEVNVDGDL